MERLGFSEDELLSHAFTKQEVWDVSDVYKPSAMASISRLTQVTALNSECGNESMHCVTPNIQVATLSDERGDDRGTVSPSAQDAEAEQNKRRAMVEAVFQALLHAPKDDVALREEACVVEGKMHNELTEDLQRSP
ncbi:hypothetical protein B5M09_014018 [Aphanomyces astaci]|nr:hypothetical protein B5M09_014018 [Aphanomyces astaci]